MHTKTSTNQATQTWVPTIARLTDTTMRESVICSSGHIQVAHCSMTAARCRPFPVCRAASCRQQTAHRVEQQLTHAVCLTCAQVCRESRLRPRSLAALLVTSHAVPGRCLQAPDSKLVLPLALQDQQALLCDEPETVIRTHLHASPPTRKSKRRPDSSAALPVALHNVAGCSQATDSKHLQPCKTCKH